jgi:hypothetical protein
MGYAVLKKDNMKIDWLDYRSEIHFEEIQICDSEEGKITVQLQASI